METSLKRLELDLTLLLHSQREHDCILELTGVCSHCETYWDIRDEIEESIMMEKDELATFYRAQSIERMRCVCRGVTSDSLDDGIIAMALIVNGQR